MRYYFVFIVLGAWVCGAADSFTPPPLSLHWRAVSWGKSWLESAAIARVQDLKLPCFHPVELVEDIKAAYGSAESEEFIERIVEAIRQVPAKDVKGPYTEGFVLNTLCVSKPLTLMVENAYPCTFYLSGLVSPVYCSAMGDKTQLVDIVRHRAGRIWQELRDKQSRRLWVLWKKGLQEEHRETFADMFFDGSMEMLYSGSLYFSWPLEEKSYIVGGYCDENHSILLFNDYGMYFAPKKDFMLSVPKGTIVGIASARICDMLRSVRCEGLEQACRDVKTLEGITARMRWFVHENEVIDFETKIKNYQTQGLKSGGESVFIAQQLM